MGETNERYHQSLRSGQNTERIEFFSDAVFAIAMTLLVIDITIPVLSTSLSGAALDRELWAAIGDEWKKFFAYALSFYVIAVNWAAHHRKFALTVSFDGGVVGINLLLLLFIAFLPYPTSLISEYGGAIPSVVFYATTVSLISLLQVALWAYAHSHGYLNETVDEGLYRYVRRGALVVPTTFLLSIPVGLVFGGDWAMYFWILALPLTIVVARWEPKQSVSTRN